MARNEFEALINVLRYIVKARRNTNVDMCKDLANPYWNEVRSYLESKRIVLSNELGQIVMFLHPEAEKELERLGE